MRIAMWSGPRNLSTAMMYSFAARGDSAVWDEPYYAAYLKDTGLDHPMRGEILDAWPNDHKDVRRLCLDSIPGEKPIFYQKHMSHHMLPKYDLGWTKDVVNVFLIRHPARVIASYAAKRENPSAQDIGFVAQGALFDRIADLSGVAPVVIDATDIRADPKGSLQALCQKIGISWTDKMLSWPAGGIEEDGPWAAHWYDRIHKSTGFAEPEGPLPTVKAEQEDVLKEAVRIYEVLQQHSLC